MCCGPLPHNTAAQESAQQAADGGTSLEQAQTPDQPMGLIENVETLGETILQTVEEDSGFKPNLLMRLGIAAAIIIAQALLIRLVWYLFNCSI